MQGEKTFREWLNARYSGRTVYMMSSPEEDYESGSWLGLGWLILKQKIKRMLKNDRQRNKTST
jgi:hypothetical protein